MRQIFHRFLLIVSIICGLFLIGIIFSFLYPNEVPKLDAIRLPIQSTLMATVSHIAIKEFTLDDKYNIVTDNTEVLSWEDIESYINQLHPGDIFFTDSNYVSSLFIPGRWQHSIIYLGTREQIQKAFGIESNIYTTLSGYYTNDMEQLIIDSTSEGVHIRNIMDVGNLQYNSYLKSLIGFRIMVNTKLHEKFLIYTIQNLGKKYDFDLITEDPSTIYCSELIYESLKKIGIKLKIMSSVLGRLIVSPNDAVDFIIQQGITNNDFKLIFFIGKQQGNVIDFVDTIEKTATIIYQP